jgi:hypothetical protein
MNWRGAILLSLLGLTGCQGAGTSRVPPPSPMAQPYYQPPGQAPAFTAPGYGAPAAAPGAISPAPGFGQAPGMGTNPVSFAPRNNINLAPTTPGTADGLSWQSPVTKQPTISRSTAATGPINPQTTLTTIRNPNTGSTNPFVNANGQPVELSSLPRAGAVPQVSATALNIPPPPGFGPATTPSFSQPVYGGTATNSNSNPWRGR